MSGLLRTSLLFFLLMTGLLGFAYPVVVWFAGQVFFSDKAEGSLIQHKGKIIGSRLLGQNFTQAGYFWPRPSATLPTPYNASFSRASNLGPEHPALSARVRDIRAQYAHQPSVPVDMVTASASGLDPHISLESALLQAPRIAKARNLNLSQVHALINDMAIRSFLAPTKLVNVLEINARLDAGYGGRK